MKLKSLFFLVCMSLFSTGFAANAHQHPQVAQQGDQGEKKPTQEGLQYPAYCEIEIINDSYSNVTVYGTFDDGVSLVPFNVYSFESPHYISLWYYGYCHAGMDIRIRTFLGYTVYAGYTPTHTTIHLVPYLTNQVKAEVKKK